MNVALRAQPVTHVLTTLRGVEVLASSLFGPTMSASIIAGRYERREMSCGLAAIPSGSRILEMGAGSGIVGAVLARNCKPTAMLAIEANPRLIPEIEALYAHNGLTNLIKLKHCVVSADPAAPKTVGFQVAGNFLRSGLHTDAGRKRTIVPVPVLAYDKLKSEFPHDVIMMDIEGAELDFLRHADLSGVKIFIAEFHRDIYGREGMRECRKLLASKGFTMDGELSAVGVHVWRKG